MEDDLKVRRLAKKLAGETLRRAEVMATQANQTLKLARFEPWPDRAVDSINARARLEKSRRLRRCAQQLERIGQNGAGLESASRPAVMFRSKAAQ